VQRTLSSTASCTEVHSEFYPLLITSRDGPHRKHSPLFFCLTFAILRICCLATETCLKDRYLETAPVYPLISLSLHSNGSTRYNIINSRVPVMCRGITTPYFILHSGLLSYGTPRWGLLKSEPFPKSGASGNKVEALCYKREGRGFDSR
jgi:hypothetical protein